jgi:hypothetical protein
MQQLTEKEQELISTLAEKLKGMSPEEQDKEVQQMLEFLSETNDDIEGMTKIIQTAQDRQKIEDLQTKLQG